MLIIHYMVVESIGILISFILTPEYATRRLNRTKMFYGDYLSRYVLLSSLAVLILLLSLLLFSKSVRNNNVSYDDAEDKEEKNYYYHVAKRAFLHFCDQERVEDRNSLLDFIRVVSLWSVNHDNTTSGTITNQNSPWEPVRTTTYYDTTVLPDEIWDYLKEQIIGLNQAPTK